MEPDNALLSDREDNEAYCLVLPGKCYAVYFTGEGGNRVKLDLSAVDGTLPLRWLDIKNCEWSPGRTVRGGGHCVLETPGNGPWVALLLGSEQSG